VPTLRRLKHCGIKTAVVSDCTHELEARWEGLPLAPLIDAVALSIRVGVCKPDPRIYLSAADQLGVAGGDCLYVGDGASNELTGAEKLGMTVVQLLLRPEEEHVSYRQDSWNGRTISNLAEVTRLIEREE
jgi:putative hydrolase of the HAD superfamily